MGQLNSMKDIVDDAKRDKGAKDILQDKEHKERESKMADQQRKIAGAAMSLSLNVPRQITIDYQLDLIM